MEITYITDNRQKEWDEFVSQEPAFGLLQSWGWGEFKEKLGWQAFRIAVEEQEKIVAGAQMLVKSMPLGVASIAYIPRGPVGKWLDEPVGSRLLSELHCIAQRHKVIFLKIEPTLLHSPTVDQTLRNHKFRTSSYTNQPRTTIILDLTQDLDDILMQMRKKTRQYIKRAARKGVTVRMGNKEDLPEFYRLMEITGQRGEFTPRVQEYYEKEWCTFANKDQVALFMAYYQDQLIAVRMVFRFGHHAAEFHAGSTEDIHNLRPNYLLVWEAIKWAKMHGCLTYDMWGIPNEVGQAVYEGDELPVTNQFDGLWGVYRFKRGFSKNVIFYANAHDYVYSPFLYSLVTNKFLDEDTLDKIATRIDTLRRA